MYMYENENNVIRKGGPCILVLRSTTIDIKACPLHFFAQFW